ncbi:MAG: hypothetical protein ACI4JJ_06590 [Huintestinicola sp.]
MGNKETQIKKSPFFTEKRKGIASLCCLGFAVLWLILWYVFPMEFYSLFFASSVGSNIVLVLLSVMITIPCNWLFSKFISNDVNMPLSLVVNAVCMLTFIYTYSIFRYTAIYWVVLAAAVHTAASVFLFIKSKPYTESKKKVVLKKRLKKALLAVVYTIFADGMYLLLFTFLLNVFREN